MRFMYFFGHQGACLQKTSTVNFGKALDREMSMHMSVMRDRDVSHAIASDIDYDINMIYWDRGRLKQRELPPVTLEGMLLNNLPRPCQIVIDGQAYDWNDLQLTLDLPYSGNYMVTVRRWPYLDLSFKVIVP
jgi:hypothetical protein